MTLRRWKSTLRAGLERLRERPRRGAALPPLSVAVIAMDCREDLIDLVEHVRGFASEVVVVDGGSRDGSIEWCRAEPLVKLVERPWDGHFGRQKNAALEACSGEWILHLDCDERVGPRLLDRLPALCTGAADFYRLPMYWLVSTGPDRYVDTPKHYPCHVPRLLRNRPEFRYCEDAPVHVRFPRAVTRSMVKIHGAHLFHYCFVWLSRAELEQKAARYRRDHPGSEATTESYYLWWQEPHRLRDCAEPAPRVAHRDCAGDEDRRGRTAPDA